MKNFIWSNVEGDIPRCPKCGSCNLIHDNSWEKCNTCGWSATYG